METETLTLVVMYAEMGTFECVPMQVRAIEVQVPKSMEPDDER